MDKNQMEYMMRKAKAAAANKNRGSVGGPNFRPTGGPTGVRYRKGQTLGGAIMGVFVGIILVFASPFVLWQAESQDTAANFQSATQVDASTVTDGYVTFQDTPVVDESLSCVEGINECLYYELENQNLNTITEEQCGNVSSDARIQYETVLECDEDGNNCQQCYQVERDVWETVSSSEDYSKDVQVGAYTVEFNSAATMLGLEEHIIEYSDTERDVWTFFPVPNELRVAGDSNNGVVTGAVESTYVLSPYGYEQTLSELESRDAANKWMFRIITFVMLFIGFSSIFGPLSYFSHVMRKIPLVGPILKDAGKFIVGLISFLLAVVTFVVLWVVIALVKNIYIVIALLAVIIGVFVFLAKRKKDDDDEKPAATPVVE
ncbi:MAG: TMEM43 family protein [Candidatus Peregrinibacteria bacterium]|nr:TMEM43 family protein [Candidatus Peregrinibacteria bacterium]